ncbi:hypothetical protein FWK35_00036924 [Aphis craccivora]|uniref:Uncharacterized protein n=1 Tax=Aphis craccivora TaxID=307492 RepID=A0A6G0Y3Y9_APHCR|nr:hypothetical protein FWK35_00036924 [Aphis craccivora]
MMSICGKIFNQDFKQVMIPYQYTLVRPKLPPSSRQCVHRESFYYKKTSFFRKYQTNRNIIKIEKYS